MPPEAGPEQGSSSVDRPAGLHAARLLTMADVLLGAISGMVFVIYGVFVLARPEQIRS